MGFQEEYAKLRKKRLEEDESKVDSKLGKDKIPAPLYQNKTVGFFNEVAPVRGATLSKRQEKEEERTWFDKGAFDDGYQFGDVTKTILGTISDVAEDVGAGFMGMGEKVVDTAAQLGAWSYGGLKPTNIGGVYTFDMKEREKAKEDAAEFIKKDLYDEEAISKKIIGAPVRWMGIDSEESSLLGEKTDSLAQSGGQLLGTVGLQALGVPWFVTTGLTSYGSGLEEAYSEGADYQDATISAAVTAGAEILTEKISGGIKFGGKALDDGITQQLSRAISNKLVRYLAKAGVDMAGEGAEEVLSGYASAIGQRLTYADDKTLGELFTKEEAMESFIGGAVLGGVSSGVNAVKGEVKGVDAVTGLNKQEQAVVDWEYKSRIEGKDLSQKEKSKIYDDVISDMDKGYISTDTIEEVLGGESFKSYKETADSEDALKQEYVELGKLTNPTLAQQTRFRELHEQIKGMKENSQRDALKSKLSEEVFTLAKGSRLEESYNERGRKSKAFEADLSQYEAKYQDTIKKAAESGILNNTRRTHDFVDMIAKISADKGVAFDFTNNEKLKSSGFAVDGVNVGGYVNENGVTLNIESSKSLNSVVGHEITHVLEGTELYNELQKSVIEYAKSKGDYQGRIDSLTGLYKDIKGANIDAELTADLVGDYLFTDPDFVKNLSVGNRNVFQKVWDEVKYLCKVATAGSKEARELAKVQRAFEAAYREGGNKAGETKYSLDMVDAVQPKSDKWSRTHTTEEAMARFPNMWNVSAEESEVRNPTQITSTVNSYRKIYNFLQGEGFNGTILDASSGLGYGTRAGVEEYGFNVEDIEPYPDKGYKPKYTDYSKLDKKYDAIISNAVLNVLPQDQRDALVAKMGAMLNDGGRMFINVRGKDVETLAKTGKNIHLGNMEWIETVKGSYQKGFTKDELKAYLEDALGDGYTVEKSNMFGAVSVIVTKNGGVKYSLSDSDGKQLSKGQQEYFKDSKMRDDEGNLKVMYHGSQDAGFHVFDPSMSDDEISLFFVDRNDVAASYSGTTETYEAKTIRSAEDMNKFLAEIGYDEDYSVTEKDGKFELLYEGERVAGSDTAQGIYEEFCWYEGVGEGDANYKVYLNLTNPLVVDAEGRNWDNVSSEFWPELYDHFKTSFTPEEKAALIDLAEWEDFSVFKNEISRAVRDAGKPTADENTKLLNSAYWKNADMSSLFSMAADNFSDEVLKVEAVKQMNTRDYAQRAKEQGYDGVIFKNIVDVGQYAVNHNPATVAIAFSSEQVKSVANDKPTGDKDIRYSLSEDSEGRELNPTVAKRFANSKAVDENGRLKVLYHGTYAGEFSIFDKAKGYVEDDFGSGFYFSDNRGDVADHYEGGGPDFENKVARLAEQIEAEEEIDYDEAEQKAREQLYKGSHLFEVYLNIENPAIVGETMLFDGEAINEQFDEEDYDDYDEYLEALDQAFAEEIENLLWEVERNVDVDNLDGLSEIIYEAYAEGGIGIEELKKKINNLYLEDSEGNLVANEVTRQIIESLGYDAVVDPTVSGKWNMNIEEGTTHYIVFKPNQIKAVTNENPTDNPDIHLSINGAKQKSYGRYNVYGKDIALEQEVAPVAEPVAEWAKEAVRKPRGQGETIPQSANADSSLYTREPLEEDIAPVDEATERYSVNDMFPDDLAPLEAELEKAYAKAEALEAQIAEAYQAQDYQKFEQLNFEWVELDKQIKTMEAEANERNTHDDADAPPEREDYAPVYSENEDAEPFEERDFKEVGNRKVNAYMYDNPEVKPFFQEEARIMLGELRDGDKAQKWVTWTDHNGKYGSESYYQFGGVKRNASEDIADLLDNVPGTTYDKIAKALQAIIDDNGKENNALSKRIEFTLDRRLREGYKVFGYNERIEPNQDYIDTVNAIEARDSEAFEDLVAHGDEYAPAEIAPYVPKKQGKIPPVAEATSPLEKGGIADAPIKPKAEKQPSMAKATPAEQARAQVLTEEPKTPKKKSGIRGMINNLVLDKGMIFEDLALKTGNRELQARWNSIRYAEGRAQRMMEKGSNSASSLKSIRDTVEKSGKTGAFYNYLYHLHNVDRMSLADRFENTENKPVFGSGVKAEDSRIEAAKLERVNPEFKTWAKDVYAYMNNLREMLVEGGVISRETANLWQEMYPHYVPIRRKGDEGLNINVALDTRRTGINAPIKRATGGNRDILPLFDTMGQRTMQTYKAIAKNRFGVELKNILGTTIDKRGMDVDEAIEGVNKHEELLKKGENGKNPTFTVFENGERVEFEITQEMYDSIKPVSDALSYTNKALNVMNNIRRGIITEYNPVFMFTNPIKDTQDVVINSQHPLKTYANYPKAIAELVGKGQYYREYMENGGEQNTYFEKDTNTFKKDKKGIVKWLGKIGEANNFIERVPRMAEYIASRKEGRSIDVSMLDAARVTTNFAAGGDLTKALNRNGFTFLNASMQGAVQQVRNVREAKANGLKGWAQLAAKVAAVGLSHELVNYLLWDDDEDYEELSDYVKRNYYVVAKYDDGKFVRIPKGRALAVIQDAFKQMGDLITGDDETDLKAFCELVISNLAPNNPLENHIFAPIGQALSNKTWYGEDLVPTRLQDLPAAEQFDESTDAISKWLGEKLNISPVKLNYLLDQYSGGIGDTLLPYIKPEATREKNTILAPFVDKFTTDGVMNNQNVSDFYNKKDELTVNANSSKATDDDILMRKYMDSVNSELAELYAKKREIQNSENLSQSEKYAAVREVQDEIVSITREALDAYDNINLNGEYAQIGDKYFKQDDEGTWEKLDDDAVTKYKVTSKAGDAKYASDGTNHYRWYEPEAGSDAEAGWRKVTDKEYERQQEVCSGLDISPEEYWANREEYSYAYDNPGSYAMAKACGGYEAYTGYSKELNDIHADKDEYGKSINGSRKEKVLEYINNLDADYTTKIILWKSEYPSDDSYNYEIINYLNSREDISEDEMRELLLKLGFGVDSEGNISW